MDSKSLANNARQVNNLGIEAVQAIDEQDEDSKFYASQRQQSNANSVPAVGTESYPIEASRT